jgi:hypothetical protein
MTPAYDRELIADMLDGYGEHTNCDMGLTHFGSAIAEQARLLREANNAEAAKVGTVPASEDGLPELPEPEVRSFRLATHNTTGYIIHSYSAEQMRAYGEQCRRLAASGQEKG